MEDGKAPKSSRTKDLAVSDEQAFSSALSDLNTGLQLDGIWSAIPQVELIAEGPLTKKGRELLVLHSMEVREWVPHAERVIP